VKGTIVRVKDAENHKSFMIRRYSNHRRRHPSNNSEYANANQIFGDLSPEGTLKNTATRSLLSKFK